MNLFKHLRKNNWQITVQGNIFKGQSQRSKKESNYFCISTLMKREATWTVLLTEYECKINNKPIELHIHKHLLFIKDVAIMLKKVAATKYIAVRFKEDLIQFKEIIFLAIKTRAVVADTL